MEVAGALAVLSWVLLRCRRVSTFDDEYVDRMKEGQNDIQNSSGESLIVCTGVHDSENGKSSKQHATNLTDFLGPVLCFSFGGDCCSLRYRW